MLLKSSARCHMPSRWPLTPHAASPTTITSPAVVQLSVLAIKEAAHGSSPRPRRAPPAPVSAHQAAWQPGAALAPPHPTQSLRGTDGRLRRPTVGAALGRPPKSNPTDSDDETGLNTRSTAARTWPWPRPRHTERRPYLFWSRRFAYTAGVPTLYTQYGRLHTLFREDINKRKGRRENVVQARSGRGPARHQVLHAQLQWGLWRLRIGALETAR